MDGARLSRFPHLSWFSIPLRTPLERGLWATTYEGTVHAVHLTRHGSYDTRWITRGRERAWRATAGQVHVAPADGETHTILVRDPSAFDSITFLLPRGHIATISAEEHVRSGGAVRQVLVADDRLLQACMIRLSTPDDRDDNQDRHKDEWARRFVLRLNELTQGGTPDWHDDASVFDRRTLLGLVAHIDARLRVGPTLADMALQVGMSPSHFGKKFRQTTGLSLSYIAS